MSSIELAAGDRILEPMIALAGCSTQQRIVVADLRNRKIPGHQFAGCRLHHGQGFPCGHGFSPILLGRGFSVRFSRGPPKLEFGRVAPVEGEA